MLKKLFTWEKIMIDGGIWKIISQVCHDALLFASIHLTRQS
jgi:hypothetical protein